MANFSSKFIKISRFDELKKIPTKNGDSFSVAEFQLMEPISKKVDGEWKTVGHNFFDAKVVGDKALQASMDFNKGVVLDLSPEIKTNEDGEQWVSHPARLEDNSWQYEGKEYHKAIVRIFDWEIRD